MMYWTFKLIVAGACVGMVCKMLHLGNAVLVVAALTSSAIITYLDGKRK